MHSSASFQTILSESQNTPNLPLDAERKRKIAIQGHLRSFISMSLKTA